MDLCGPPNPKTSLASFYSDSGVEQMEQSDSMKEWEDEFQALGIEDMIREWVGMEMEASFRLQKAFQESGLSRRPGFDYLKPEDYENLSHTFFEEHIRLDVDKSKTPSDRLSIDIDWPEESSEQFKKGLQTYAQNVKEEINSSFSKQIHQGIYTPREAYALLQEKWKTFIEKYRKEKQTDVDFDSYQDIAEGVKKMRESMDRLKEIMREIPLEEEQHSALDENDKTSDLEAPPIYEFNIAADILEELEQNFTVEKTGSGPERKLTCQTAICQQAVEEVIQEMFSYYERPLPQKERVDRYSAQCLSQFAQLRQIEEAFPGELDIPQIKETFSKGGLRNFSFSTRKSFEDYIGDDFHIRPLTLGSQDFKVSIENRLKRRRSFQYQEPENTERSHGELIDVMYQDKMALEFQDSPPCLKIKKPVLKSIDGFRHPEHTDNNGKSVKGVSKYMQNILSKGAISLSLFSCQHPHYGQGIASHEMGHLLSWLFAQKKLSDKSYGSYKRLRECATKRYRRLNKPSKHSKLLHGNDQFYTEEDTADLMSYLAYQDSQTHYSCSFFPITEDGTQYKGIEVLNTNQKDTHSSDLLRVLFEAIHKRVELSSACRQVMDHYKNEINFEPCF